MNRFHALLVVCLLWAAIYLPGLGSTELRGEEGRRILPAMTMLETGNFLVPYVGGKPYLRKPPLVTWSIAGVFAATGLRNEWTARVPSVLSVLAVAILLVALAGRPGWLTVEPALVAALLFLTQVATADKGRLAEIEAMYFSLSGAAIVLWLIWWGQERSPWLWWIVPHLLLGLGLLAKVPLHLLFYYAIVVAVLWKAGELRRLYHPAHFVGLLLMAGIFFAWEVPYMKTPAAAQYAMDVWREQSVGRLKAHFDLLPWATNIGRALSNHLPWLLLAPLLWRRDLTPLGRRERALFEGTRLAVVITFFSILVLPGMLPRYALPLLAPFAVLLAYAVADERLLPPAAALRFWWRTNTALAVVIIVAALASPVVHALSRSAAMRDTKYFPGGVAPNFEFVLAAAGITIFIGLFVFLGRYKLARPALLTSATAALIGAGLILYAAIGIPMVNSHDRLRPAARKIDSEMPTSAGLVLYDPEYQPLAFYLQTPHMYAAGLEEVPKDNGWIEARDKGKRSTTPGRTVLDDDELESGLTKKKPTVSTDPVPRGKPWILAREESRHRVQEGLPEYVPALTLPKPLLLVLLRPSDVPAEAPVSTDPNAILPETPISKESPTAPAPAATPPLVLASPAPAERPAATPPLPAPPLIVATPIPRPPTTATPLPLDAPIRAATPLPR